NTPDYSVGRNPLSARVSSVRQPIAILMHHNASMPTRRLALLVLLIVGAVQLVTVSPAGATPPGIPSPTTARSELATLTVAAWTHTTTYNRALFPTWDTISGTCNTRETVLKRDGSNVVVNSSCAAV